MNAILYHFNVAYHDKDQNKNVRFSVEAHSSAEVWAMMANSQINYDQCTVVESGRSPRAVYLPAAEQAHV